MTAEPIWFGPPGRPLFGWFHAPADNRARAGVVVCPPLSRDYLQAHYALRRVAVGLEREGIAVLRFDYDGTGDSFGATDDPGRVEAWLGSVAAALEVVRRSGVTRVGLLGMRIGALFAAAAAERDGAVDDIVLWDPVGSGKAYVSEQRALASLSFGSPPTHDDGSIETPGMLLSAETVAAMRALDVATAGLNAGAPLATRALVLTRGGRTPPRALGSRLAASDTEFAEATGQEELMDVGSPFQVLPEATIERVVAWVARGAEAAGVPIVPPARAGAMVVGALPDGREIVETPTALGPLGLFAVTTEAAGATAVPTVMLLSVANEHHIGPNRLWVELARKWAALGISSVRFDLSGLGDSPTRPGQAEFVARAPAAFDDVADIARVVSPDDPANVIFVGLCSAAYQAIENALVLSPRGIIAVNPVLSFLPPEMIGGGTIDPRRRACLPRTALVEKFHDDGPLAPLRRRFPNLGWSIRNFIARGQRPSIWLRELTAMGVDSLFVCGDREIRQIRQGMSTRTYERLLAARHLELEFVPGLDHGLLLSAHRAQVSDMMTAFLTARVAASQPEVRVVKGRVINVASISRADEDAWRALAQRAVEPNPLYEPDCLIPAARHQTFGAEIAIVVAEEDGRFHALVPIRHVKRWHKLPYPIVTTQVRRMIYQGTPLVDADRGVDACAAVLDALGDERRAGRSRVFALQELTGGGPVDACFRAAAADRGLWQLEFESFERGFLRRRDPFRYTDIYSTRTLSDLRRKRRRLTEAVGGEPTVVDRGGDADAVDDYIALESSGYKAEIGVALTTVEGETAFFRDMCQRFAAAGRLHVIALEAGGQTLAMNIWITAGSGICMIKWSFDEKYSRFSPGLQLHMDSLEHFHSGTDAMWMDSCTFNGNDLLMRVLPDRRRITSYFIALEPGRKAWLDRLAMQSFIALRPWHTRLYERRHPAERGAQAARRDSAAGSD